MTPQPLKVRADVELTCFAYDGVERIREAMRAAEAAGSEDCPVRMKLVAPPLYVLTTQTLDKVRGVEVLTAACEACQRSIESAKGKLAVKEAARAVSERDDRLLAEKMEALEAANREVCCGRCRAGVLPQHVLCRLGPSVGWCMCIFTLPCGEGSWRREPGASILCIRRAYAARLMCAPPAVVVDLTTASYHHAAAAAAAVLLPPHLTGRW